MIVEALKQIKVFRYFSGFFLTNWFFFISIRVSKMFWVRLLTLLLLLQERHVPGGAAGCCSLPLGDPRG